MDLKQLYYFVKTAEFEHMTKAANYLDVSQPFLSKSISDLERELGIPLFDHVGRGIKLNRNGMFFYQRVSAILSELDAVCDNLRRQTIASYLDTIRIGSNSVLYMPHLLTRLSEREPNVQIISSTACTERLIEQLKNKEIDLAIVSPEQPRRYSITSVHLANDLCPVIYPEGHWLQHARSVRLTDLQGEKFIGVNEGLGIRESSDTFFGRAGFKPNYYILTNDAREVREFVKAGRGIAFTSLSTLKMDPFFLDHHKLIEDPPCWGTIGLCYLEAQNSNAFYQKFVQLIKEHFNESIDYLSQSIDSARK